MSFNGKKLGKMAVLCHLMGKIGKNGGFISFIMGLDHGISRDIIGILWDMIIKWRCPNP